MTWGTISAPQIVILSIIFENGTKIFEMEQKWNKNGGNMLSKFPSKTANLSYCMSPIVVLILQGGAMSGVRHILRIFLQHQSCMKGTKSNMQYSVPKFRGNVELDVQ